MVLPFFYLGKLRFNVLQTDLFPLFLSCPKHLVVSQVSIALLWRTAGALFKNVSVICWSQPIVHCVYFIAVVIMWHFYFSTVTKLRLWRWTWFLPLDWSECEGVLPQYWNIPSSSLRLGGGGKKILQILIFLKLILPFWWRTVPCALLCRRMICSAFLLFYHFLQKSELNGCNVLVLSLSCSRIAKG